MTLPSPSGLFRLQCHLKPLSFPSAIRTIKAFNSSPALDTEETQTPAMKVLKDIPYQSASPDHSIFEHRSDQYDLVPLPPVLLQKYEERLASSRSAYQSYHASRALEHLARSGKFGEAEQVRQELVETDVPIRPSDAYIRVAWNVLRLRPWPPNRTELFVNWLSLVPNMMIGKKRNFYPLLQALFFGSRHLDFNTIAQCGIILSSKGYIRKVGSSVVACLSRYADPNFSSRILDEVLAANGDYRRRRFRTTHKSMARMDKRTARRLWSVAVRSHCTAGRPEVAFQMAKRAHEQNFRLTEFAYEFLLGKLEADGLHDLAAELRAHPYCGPLDVAKSRLVVNVSNPTNDIIRPISRSQSMDTNLETALAILKGSSQGLPAYAGDIVPYFNIYKTHVRGAGAVNTLRSRAYRISLTAVSAVFLAEQLHHHRRGQFRHVLWVFEKFFHVVGVPSEDITRRLWKRKDYLPHLRMPLSYIPSYIKKSTFNLPSKIWPTPYHTALVWSALAHLCESEEEIFALYDTLLQHGARFQKKETTVGHQHRHPSHGDSSSSILALVPAPKDKFDAAHFLPFLIAFAELRGAQSSLRVLDDMQDCGIMPSAQFLSTAAAIQARHGEPALALRMLEIIHGLIERDEGTGAGVEMESVGPGSGVWMGMGVRERERERKWQKLLAAYTSVLRGLIDRRDIVQARRVADLIHNNLGYVEGSGDNDGEGGSASSHDVRTDTALEYLRRLEWEGPYADVVPDPVTDPDVGHFYPFLRKRDFEVCPPNFFFFFNSPPFGFFPITLCFFPDGENHFAVCCFFFLSRLMEVTAQLIKTLNAAPSEPII